MAKDTKKDAAGKMNPLALKRLDLANLLSRTRLVSMTPQAINNWLQSGCPRNSDGTFNIIAVCAWLAAERRKKELKANDPMLSGPNSPALEAYRKIKTKREQLAYDRESRQLIPVEEVRREWVDMGHRMRSALDAVCRTLDPESNAAIQHALDQVYGEDRERRAPGADPNPPRAS
jgi:hypothetical protein